MLKLPGNLTAETFLDQHWQKQALFMPAALERVRPAITRNELAWLATLEDVESRLVFVDRDRDVCHYHVETGPFDPEYLQSLPKHDWTLLVQDVEKHLPAMRSLLQHVPFIPDWRIDDIMVSFAAPGGGVGPHKDNYDVFLCQGIGARNWRYTSDDVVEDPGASDELALLSEFAGGQEVDTAEGDVLYLPPGTPHWGTAKRACMTYSIGMRAPRASEISFAPHGRSSSKDDFYRDPDLCTGEAVPGYISKQSVKRAIRILDSSDYRDEDVAESLGCFATLNKDWLKPDEASASEIEAALELLRGGSRLPVHGMSQIAFDDRMLYVNGSSKALPKNAARLLQKICADRSLLLEVNVGVEQDEMLRWMLQLGAFDIPEPF